MELLINTLLLNIEKKLKNRYYIMIKFLFKNSNKLLVFIVFCALCFCLSCYAKKTKVIECSTDLLNQYRMLTAKKIHSNWRFKNSDNTKIIDQVKIFLTINKDGQIQQTEFQNKPANDILNESALIAIEKSKPFSPLPGNCNSYKILVIFTPKSMK